MKNLLVGLVIIPTLSLASIHHPNSLYDKSSLSKNDGVVSPALIKEVYNEKIKEEQHLEMPENWDKYIKRPKHTNLNDELKKQYQENFQILKKCYVKPQDNLQDIMIVMGKFINAYSDIVYGKEIISYNQEIQDYDRILSNAPINKSANPEECLKAREFFENQLM